MTEQEHSEDIEDLTAEISRLTTALRIAGVNIVEMNDKNAALNEKNAELTAALTHGLLVMDALITDLRAAGGQISPMLEASKAAFDQTMKRVLGEDRSFRSITEKPDEKPKN
jgi:hypothetical protein